MPMGFSDNAVYWTDFLSKVIFMLSIVIFGWLFGRDPNGVGKLAFFTTPVLVVIMAAFPFFAPSLFSCVIFSLSPVFMTPLFVRRLYGVIRTANPNRLLFTFMSGIAIGFIVMQSWLFPFEFEFSYEPSLAATFLVMAALPLISWVGVRRKISYTDKTVSASIQGVSKKLLAVIIAAVLLSFWLMRMKGFIEYAVEQYDSFLYIPVYNVLPPLVYALYGFLGDKKREKLVFVGITIIYLVSIQLAFLSGHNPDSYAELPLVVANRLFSSVVEYLFWTVPIYFLIRAKRPVFVASFGGAIYLLCWAFRWGITRILPDALRDAGAPLYIATSLPVIIFFVLLYYVYIRYREMTLAAALYALLHGDTQGERKPILADETIETPDEPETAETQSTLIAGLTEEEMKIAALMIEGVSYRDIARKLHMSAADFNRHEKEIR